MTKILIKLITYLTGLLLVLFTTCSCAFDSFMGVKGNQHVISETRTITEDFNKIRVSQGIVLQLIQENNTKLKVEADENIIDLLVTEVKNNELKIYFSKNVYKAKARKVFLTTSKITQIKTSSGASVRVKNTINSDELFLDTNSGSNIKATVNCANLECQSSSGAIIKVEGKTNSISTNASSGSVIKAKNVIANSAQAKASSGANITINAKEKLNAKASSGGVISYFGNPKNIEKNSSFGGSISKK